MSQSLVADFKHLVVELKDGNKILFSSSCSFEFVWLDKDGWFWKIYDYKGRLISSFSNKLVKKRGIGYVC